MDCSLPELVWKEYAYVRYGGIGLFGSFFDAGAGCFCVCVVGGVGRLVDSLVQAWHWNAGRCFGRALDVSLLHGPKLGRSHL